MDRELREFTQDELKSFGIEAHAPIKVGKGSVVSVDLQPGDHYQYVTIVVFAVGSDFWCLGLDHHHDPWEDGDNQLTDCYKDETLTANKVFPVMRRTFVAERPETKVSCS